MNENVLLQRILNSSLTWQEMQALARRDALWDRALLLKVGEKEAEKAMNELDMPSMNRYLIWNAYDLFRHHRELGISMERPIPHDIVRATLRQVNGRYEASLTVPHDIVRATLRQVNGRYEAFLTVPRKTAETSASLQRLQTNFERFKHSLQPNSEEMIRKMIAWCLQNGFQNVQEEQPVQCEVIGGLYLVDTRGYALNNKEPLRILHQEEANGRLQLTIQSVEKEIPWEVHERVTQMIRVEEGTGRLDIRNDLGTVSYDIRAPMTLIIPAGTMPRIRNTSENGLLKLTSVYAKDSNDREWKH